MSLDRALELMREVFIIAATVAGPALAAALLVGLFVGVIQTATQVNEASVSFVTKLLAVAGALLIGGPWALTELIEYTRRTIGAISEVVR
jgi:flagellar biosynthetic protein FliQ